MPRHARILNEKNVYHVMLRGNNRGKIFIDNEDKQRIIETIRLKKKDREFFIYAYCVLDNHIHLVIREGEDSLSRIVKRIATSYAYYFNKKYNRMGHVFQDRFRSENIEDDKYLLCAIRYVHRNPVKAGLGSIEDYPWSSYKEFMDKKTDLVESNEIFGIISNNKVDGLKGFAQFHQESNNDIFLELVDEKEVDATNVKLLIDEFLQKYKIEISQLKSAQNKKFREELINLIIKKSDLSLRRIAEELGLNREMVRKAALSKEPSP
jgi:REP element-mobilizing transposase RayT